MLLCSHCVCPQGSSSGGGAGGGPSGQPPRGSGKGGQKKTSPANQLPAATGSKRPVDDDATDATVTVRTVGKLVSFSL